MVNKRLKIGFIGGGINSAIGETHKIASQMDGKFQLESGCFSRDINISKDTAESWGIERFYSNYKEFIKKERDKLDAIVILTPTDNHTDIILESLKNKLPVICEKTLTTSSEEAIKIKSSLKRYNGFLVTTYNYTGYPMVRELEAIISSGKIGKVTQINIQMPQESFIRLNREGKAPKPQSWRLKDGKISTLSLDLGTHLSNMVSFLTKESPEEAVAIGNSFGHYNIIDNIIALVKYSNGIDCQMWYSKSALGHKNGLKIEVYGDKGAVKWYQMNPEFLEFDDNFGRNIILDRASKDIQTADKKRYNRFKSGHPAGFIEAFANHYIDIYEALQKYKSGSSDYLNRYVFGVEDSIRELKVMEAIEKSLKSKSWESSKYE